jgi:hypothetical protein
MPQDIFSHIRDMNPEFLEYEAGVLLTRPQGSLVTCSRAITWYSGLYIHPVNPLMEVGKWVPLFLILAWLPAGGPMVVVGYRSCLALQGIELMCDVTAHPASVAVVTTKARS